VETQGYASHMKAKKERKSIDPYQMGPSPYYDLFPKTSKDRQGGNARQFGKKASRSQNPNMKSNKRKHIDLNGSFGNPISEKKNNQSSRNPWSGVQVPNFA
jgi:hypothetical protein